MATKADVKLDISTNYIYDNNANEITPALNRGGIDQVIDNCLFIDDNGPENGLGLNASNKIALGGELIENTAVQGSGTFALNLGNAAPNQLASFTVAAVNDITLRSETVTGFSNLQNNSFAATFLNQNAFTNDQALFFASTLAGEASLGFNLLGNPSTAVKAATNSTTGFTITNSGNALAGNYADDYFVGALPASERTIPDTGLMTRFLGETDLAEEVRNPTALNDAEFVQYDLATDQYVLNTAGGGGGIGGTVSASFIPFGTAPNTVGDSALSVNELIGGTDTTTVTFNDLSVNTEKEFVITGQGNLANSRLRIGTGTNGFGDTYTTELFNNNDMGFYSYYNIPDGGNTVDRTGIRLPQSTNTAFELRNFFSQEIGTAQVFGTLYGGITNFGHKFSTSSGPGAGSADDDYVFASLQSGRNFVVGGLFGGTGGNASLIVKSQPTASQINPHIQLANDYDDTTLATSDYQIWRNGGRIMAQEGSTKYNVITQNLFDIPGVPADPGGGPFTLQLNGGVLSWV